MVVAPAQRLRVISWNLLHGQKIPPTNSQDWQVELASAAKRVADQLQPNFIALQEVDYFQSRSDFTNQTEVVAQNMQLKYWAYLPTLIGTPGEKWRSVKDLKNSIITQSSLDKNPKASYGIALATNWPIKKLYVKKLGRVRFIYVKDEPRVALIAELENGYTIATTHLSFVPGVNIFQLNKLSFFLKKLPGLALLTGDLNLPANLPSKLSGFKSLVSQATYPSWRPKIQFDYIMLRKKVLSRILSIKPIQSTATQISDHTPIGVEIQI